MPADISALRHKLDFYYGKFLPSGIGLFEEGAPGDALSVDGFITRVNRRIFLRAIPPAKLKNRDLATAVSSVGRLGLHAELVVFGSWMLRDGMPGSGKRPGKAPDLSRLFQTAAAAFAALTSPNRSPVAKRILTKDIVKFWNTCFDETTATSDHSASMRSLRKILPEYLEHLKAGHLQFNGRKVTASPQMSRLARALKTQVVVSLPKPTTVPGTGVSHPVRPATPSVCPAAPLITPTTFEIQLQYSSPDVEAEYRNAAAPAPVVPCLSYKILPVEATTADHTLRTDRIGRVMFKPDLDVNRMVRVEALIDRIALTFTTKRLTSPKVLWNAIAKKVDNAVYVSDRTIKANTNDWVACLPELDHSKLTGQYFVVMVQEPTPTSLRAVLNTIADTAGIDADVQPCLLELAVDFYPREHANPVEALLTREQIVGLVQRHHWSAGAGFLAHEPEVPRRVDLRQFYSDNGKGQTRYLFAAAGDKLHSDTQLQEASVRRRLLNVKHGNDLYLNATIYRGVEMGPRRTNVQHKIADRRNAAKGTSVELANTQRRARAEMTLSSLEALEQAGLKTVEDLVRCRFRRMSRNMLNFRLPTCVADSVAIEAAIMQMKTRGVYGVEMSQRAKVHEQREGMRPKPRKTDRDGWALIDWHEMSGMVGAALDRLQKSWRRF